ncbi:PadR family transcriptional regulator [Brevibacterium rongguiense]|uniref:PadR family transcriptional regulator n=1 Tax=Brevibacterium rongguiense TaxID=2695267 RepID=UPI0038B3CD7B
MRSPCPRRACSTTWTRPPSARTPRPSAPGCASAEPPAHPYEMYRTMLRRHDDRLVKVSPGTLYHQVGRLAEYGLVRERGTERAGNRPERTTYAITSAGREALRAEVRRLIAEPTGERSDFRVGLAEIGHLSAPAARAALADRLANARAEREEARAAIRGIERVGLAERHWLDHTYGLAVAEAQIAWLAGVLERLDAGALAWEGSRIAGPS